MKQIIKYVLVFMLSIFVMVPSAAAWDLVTHQNIATNVYSSLPADAQQKLDLNEMKRGSIAPDVEFHDGKNHEYPRSATQAKKWLNKGKTAYKNKNYKEASYDYGVASHYISDTYSAPHSTNKETSDQHAAYESQATNMAPAIGYKKGSLNSQLSSGHKQGQSSWKNWAKTQNQGIVQNDLNNAASASYSQIKNNI